MVRTLSGAVAVEAVETQAGNITPLPRHSQAVYASVTRVVELYSCPQNCSGSQRRSFEAVQVATRWGRTKATAETCTISF